MPYPAKERKDKNMKKKLVSLILAVSMVGASVCGCGSGSADQEKQGSDVSGAGDTTSKEDKGGSDEEGEAYTVGKCYDRPDRHRDGRRGDQ